jgi:hypothetical protein
MEENTNIDVVEEIEENYLWSSEYVKWHAPKLLDRLKGEFEVKIVEEYGVGACSLARSTLGVEGCAKVPGWD